MLLSEEQEMIRDLAREFARQELAPHAARWAREHAFPADALRQMGGLGLLGMLVPAEWDGAGVDHVAYALAIEEIAAGDGAVSTIMSVHNSVGCMPVFKYGSEAQKAREAELLSLVRRLISSSVAVTAQHCVCPSTTTSCVPNRSAANSTLPTCDGATMLPATRITNSSPSP